MDFLGEADEQRPIADRVDNARCAFGNAIDRADRGPRKFYAAPAARHVEPVRDVLKDFLLAQRAQVIARRNPLVELAQFVEFELFTQFFDLANTFTPFRRLLGGTHRIVRDYESMFGKAAFRQTVTMTSCVRSSA